MADDTKKPRPAQRKPTVLERRLKGANPYRASSGALPLRDPDLVVHIASGAFSATRHYDMVNELGWEPVTVDDLAVPPDQCGYMVNPSGYVCRGAKGEDIAYKMKRADFEKIQHKKAAYNTKVMRSKETLANSVAAAHGPEAAEAIHKGIDETRELKETVELS